MQSPCVTQKMMQRRSYFLLFCFTFVSMARRIGDAAKIFCLDLPLFPLYHHQPAKKENKYWIESPLQMNQLRSDANGQTKSMVDYSAELLGLSCPKDSAD